MTIVETLPVGQSWLIKSMQTLTDQPMLEMGVCYGLAQTALLEILDQKDVAELNKIFYAINNIPMHTFKATIENIHHKYLELVKSAKEKVYLELGANSRKSVDERVVRKLAQKYINEGLERFSDVERTQLKIRSLMESIELAQIPFLHTDIFNNETIEQGDESVPPMICSNKLNSADDHVMKLDTMSGIYTLEELTALFEELQKTLENTKEKYPIALLFDNLNHGISISFLPDKGWVFVDANNLPAKIIKESNKLASMLISAFGGHGNSAFETNVYITKKHEADCRARLEAFKSTAIWKKVNEITEEKVKQEDSTQNTWLYIAARAGDKALVDKLLHAKADPNHVTSYGTNALFIAAYSGHLEVVKQLIKGGAQIDALNDGETALFVAAAKNYFNIVKELLSEGANPNLTDAQGLSALVIAAKRGNTDVVKLLMRHVRDVSQFSKALFLASQFGKVEVVKLFCKINPIINQDMLGITALYVACVNNHPDVVKLLLASGADPNIYTITGKTPLMAAAEAGNLEVVDLLLNVVADVKQLNGALCLAAKEGHMDVIKTLLKRNVDIDIEMNNITPLCIAAFHNHIDVVKLLLDIGANPNQPNSLGATPLVTAATAGNIKVVKLLLKYVNDTQQFTKAFCFAAETGHLAIVNTFIKRGINLNGTVNGCSTALFVAAANNQFAVVKTLVDAGANTACRNNEGNTPLIAAAFEGYVDVVKYLLTKPEDIEKANVTGVTALMAAISNNHVPVVKLLLDANANVNMVNISGTTSLLLAIQNDNLELVEELIKHHADVNLGNDKTSPLCLAAQNGNMDIVRLLIEHGALVNAKAAGKTAYDVAVENDNKEVAVELAKVSANDSPDNDDTVSLIETKNPYRNMQNNLKLFKPVSVAAKTNERLIEEEEAVNTPVKSAG